MTNMLLLTEDQIARLSPFLPLSHGKHLLDGRPVSNCSVCVICSGLMWRDALVSYGPQKTIYNRFVCWSHMGVFGHNLMEFAKQGCATDVIMINATNLKAHRTTSSLVKKGHVPRFPGRTKGGLNSKLHMVCHGLGRTRSMFPSARQTSDYTGVAALQSSLPAAKLVLAGRGCDADWFWSALADRAVEACIPSKTNRKRHIFHDRLRNRNRHQI